MSRVGWAALVLTAASGGLGCAGADPGPSAEALAEYGRSRTAKSQAVAVSGADQPNVSSGDVGPGLAPAVLLTVVGAEGLPDFDSGLGETDAYVRIEWDGRRYQTSVAPDTTAPAWGDSFLLPIRAPGTLQIEVYDEDVWSDERMAVVGVPLPRPAMGETIEWVVPLKDGEGGLLRLRVLGVERP